MLKLLLSYNQSENNAFFLPFSKKNLDVQKITHIDNLLGKLWRLIFNNPPASKASNSESLFTFE